MQKFSFLTATEILFGRGEAQTAPERILSYGSRVVFVHGRSFERVAWLSDALIEKEAEVFPLAMPHEPQLGEIERALAELRLVKPDVVVAIGGGSVIDAGKALAALLPAKRPTLDHLEVVGKGLPLEVAPLAFIALPTTSGTGAEVTKNAVIGVEEHRRKVSLRDSRMLPDLAIIDPSLTDNTPRPITLATGLDAITQVIEPYLSTKANPLTDAICRDAIPRGLTALKRLMEEETPQARDEMAWVSLCGGMALANAGLGAVHGLAGPLGGLTGASHGALCGKMLPPALAINYSKSEDQSLKARFDFVGEALSAMLGLDAGLSFEEVTQHLARWAKACGLPDFKQMGVSDEAMQAAAKAASSSSSMKANPVILSEDDLMLIMQKA